MKNTRSSGLEMLKGREADKINLAPIAARKLNGNRDVQQFDSAFTLLVR
jgi:hypothetical protein